MSDSESIGIALMAFVTRSFNVTEKSIDVDQSLIDQGVIDSFGLLEITTFIENKFAVKVRESDMTREAFGSLRKMVRFISARVTEEKA